MTFECSNRQPMNEPQQRLGSASTRRLWLSAQFLGCAVLVAACGGGGGATDQASPATGTDTPAPTPAPSPAPAPSPSATGTATLTWVAPQTNADGSALNDLAGYRIYYGTSTGSYTESVTISDPMTTTYTVQNLAASTYFFVLRAYDKSNVESASSAEVSKTIR